MLTCTGVSFAHGSNDGQKGMGLIVLILVGIVPTVFALDLATSSDADASIGYGIHERSLSLTRAAPGGSAPVRRRRGLRAKQLTRYLRSGRLAPETLPALAVVNAARPRDWLT